MREHADKMTADMLHLSEQLSKTEEEQRQRSQALEAAFQRSYQDVKERLERWKDTLPEEVRIMYETERLKLKEKE
jgi:hypothetical protein